MKKKRLAIVGLMVAMVCLGVLVGMLPGCSKFRYVEPSEFERQVESENAQTVYWYEYIGQADGRVFVLRKRHTLIGRGDVETVLYTEADELGEPFMKKLEDSGGRIEGWGK